MGTPPAVSPRARDLTRKALPYFPGDARELPAIPRTYLSRVPPRVEAQVERFLRSAISPDLRDGFRGLAFGLSGGLDSSTVAALSLRAVGRDRTFAVIVDLGLPGHREQTAEATQVARALGVPYRVYREGEIYRRLLHAERQRGPFSEVNAVTRTIHGVVAQVADARSFAVVSCVDRSEILLARHTEYFYGHLAPLAPLFKTEVRALATRLGVPAEVLALSPGCVEAWLDESVLGAPYDLIDPLLYLMVDRRLRARDVHRRWGGDRAWLERVQHRTEQRDWRMVTRAPSISVPRRGLRSLRPSPRDAPSGLATVRSPPLPTKP